MDNQLNVCLVQTDNSWEDIDANLMGLTKKLHEIDEDADLIILPELFSTGFTMEAKAVAESMDGKGVTWMKTMSKVKQSLIIGSLLISEAGSFFNRLIVAFPNGDIQYYNKRHLFSYAGEDKVFKAGSKRLVVEYKGFKICPLICYDLRFPVWARNTEEVDVFIFVANWPDARMLAWDTLLKARAIENLCYVVGVNRVGVDSNNLVYAGHSTVVDAMGVNLIETEPSKEGIFETILEKSHIISVREKFSFLDDRDQFEIT